MTTQLEANNTKQLETIDDTSALLQLALALHQRDKNSKAVLPLLKIVQERLGVKEGEPRP